MTFTIGVTGHRYLAYYQGSRRDKIIHGMKRIVFHLLKDKIREGGDLSVNTITGMARGADLLFGRSMIDARRYYRGELGIPFTITAAIPYSGQYKECNGFPTEAHLYSELSHRCDVKKILSNYYYTGCYKKRNRYIVDNSDVLIAVWDGKPSGTGQTVRMAKEKGIPVIVLDPKTFEDRVLQY